MSKNNYDIAVLGEWHLAFVTASVLAHCGHKVALIKSTVENPWTQFPPIPVMEPGLNEMILEANKKGLLFFENGVSSNWKATNVWLAVDTPVNDQDEPDVEPLLVLVNQIKQHQQNIANFIISSQVPLGFGLTVHDILKVPVSYVPENLRLGKGIDTFMRADRTVVGSTSPNAAENVRYLMQKFETEFLLTNLVTAEMVKHANNIFLATSISFANELARVGEKFNVDSMTVGKALKLDKRIGSSAYVMPGLGFAGGTLPRDLRVMQKIGKKTNIPTPLVDAVLTVNQNTTTALAEIILSHLKKSKSTNNVLILGYTYKADTDTLRRSMSIDLAKILNENHVNVFGFDPIMNNKDLTAINGLIQHCPDLNLKTKFSAIVCMTARTNFKEINWSLMASESKNTLILDTQNILDGKGILNSGFLYQQLWGPLQNPVKEG